MCSKVSCTACGKWTWEGCGEHIAEALAGISKELICTCPR